jgi:Phosphopantetheine attachment site
MTHSRTCSSGHIRGSQQSPANAQRETIRLSTDSARTADPESQVNAAYAAHPASPDAELLPVLLDLAYEVLGIRCNPGENFFDYGDSLAAAQLCALGARRYGWTMTTRDIFAWESFALLAWVIERDEAARRTTGATPEQKD